MTKSPSLFLIALTMVLCGLCITGCGSPSPGPTAPVAPAGSDRTADDPTPSPTNTATPQPATASPVPPTLTPEPAGAPLVFADSGQRLGSANSWDVALGDLDGDDDLDAFVANSVQGAAHNAVWLNDGTGSFSAGEAVPGFGQGVALGDLDGDKDLDAVVANWAGGRRSAIWLNDGSGLFSESAERLAGAFRPGLGDLDGDEDLDIVLAQMHANTVWLNDGNGAFSDSGQRLGTAITAGLAVDDLDGDGDLDVLAGGWDEAARVWLNDGEGNFAEHDGTLCPASVHIHDLAVGDLDNDGDPDAFMAVASRDTNQVWLNDGVGGFIDTAQPLHAPLAHGLSLGDLDGDGDLDAVTGHGDLSAGPHGARIWLNDGAGGFSLSEVRLGDLYAPGVALGDLDNDNDLDAFIGHGETWQEHGGELPNTVWLNQTNPSGAARSRIVVPPATLPTIDGTLSEGEWDDARVEFFADGSELLLMHVDNTLYLGVRASGPDMIVGNVHINRGDEITILHSSAALGTGVYRRGEDGWGLVQEFVWCCRPAFPTIA